MSWLLNLIPAPYLIAAEAILMAVIVSLSFYGGYHLHTLQDTAGELAAKNKSISDFKSGEEYRNALSASYEQGKQVGATSVKTIHTALSAARKASPQADCKLSSDDLKAINQ